MTAYPYIEVVQPKKFTICGVELKDFSLGHWMLLEMLSNLFIAEGDKPANVDLELGIAHLSVFLLICGHSYEDNLIWLDDPELLKQILEGFNKHLIAFMYFGEHRFLNWLVTRQPQYIWQIRYYTLFRECLLKKWFTKKYLLNESWNIYEQIAKVKEYLLYFTKIPKFTDMSNAKSPSDTRSGIDWKQSLYTILKNEYNYTKSEILNMSLRKVFYEWCSYAEKNGGIKVVDLNELYTLNRAGHVLDPVEIQQLKMNGFKVKC